MRLKNKLKISNWVLDYVAQIEEDYNELAEPFLDTEEMIEKCLVDAIDYFLEDTLRITRYVIHGNCFSMEALEAFIDYMNHLERKISGLQRDCLYYEDEPLKIIQQNKNILYKLVYYKRNHVNKSLRKKPSPTEIVKCKMILRKKMKFNFQYTTWSKIDWFVTLAHDDGSGQRKRNKESYIYIDSLLLSAYDNYFNRDYYSTLKLPLSVMEMEDLKAFHAIINEYSPENLEDESLDEAFVKTLKEMKESMERDLRLMEKAEANEKFKANIYPFKMIMHHQEGREVQVKNEAIYE